VSKFRSKSSVGFKPLKKQPLSIAFVLPVTFAHGVAAPSTPGSVNRGFEDSVLTARYRVDAPSMASWLDLNQVYVMGVGGLEMPTLSLLLPMSTITTRGSTTGCVTAATCLPVAALPTRQLTTRREASSSACSSGSDAG
jgi:hypothetical protein